MLNILLEAAVLCSKINCKINALIALLEYIDFHCSIRVSFAICLVPKTNIWEGYPIYFAFYFAIIQY